MEKGEISRKEGDKNIGREEEIDEFFEVRDKLPEVSPNPWT